MQQATTMKWAHVQYVCDKATANVPISFFEAYKPTQDLHLLLFQTYNVFWSPNDEDTPDTIMEKEHKVLKIEEIKRSSRDGTPIAGYYQAVVLKLAGSEEELEEVLQKGGRIRKPKQVADVTKPPAQNASHKRKLVQQHQKKARESHLKNLGVAIAAETDPVKSKYNIDSSESEDENVEDDRDGVPLVQYEDLQKKYEHLEKKYKDLQCNLQKKDDEVHQLRTLNLSWQMELKKAFEEGGMRNENKKVKRQDLLRETKDDEASNITNMKRLNNKKEEGEQEASTSRAIDDNNDGTGLFDTTNINCVSEEQFKAANKVVNGVGGDSRFVKNICDALWTREELAARSAMGKACPNKQGCEARPECTPTKKQYIQDLLERRMDLEIVKMSFGDREKRTSKVAEYIRAKIKAVRRAEGCNPKN